MNEQEFKDFVFSLSRDFSLGNVASGLAHEMNNPLAVITGNVDMLNLMLEINKLDEEKLKSSLEKVEEAAYNLAVIVKKIWEFSANKNESKVVLSTQDIFENISVFFQKKFESNSVEFVSNFNVNHLFMGIESEMSLIFLNCLSICFESVARESLRKVEASSKLIDKEIEINFTVHHAKISPESFNSSQKMSHLSTQYYLEKINSFHRILSDDSKSTFQFYVPSH